VRKTIDRLALTAALAIAASVAIILSSTCSFAGDIRLAAAEATGQCVVRVTPVKFGNYKPLTGSDLPSMGLVHYQCIGKPRSLSIGLTAGQSGAFGTRLMGRGPHKLRYNISRRRPHPGVG
jgi:hypothetical protein